MISIRSITPLILLAAILCQSLLWSQSGPVEISNTGEIKVNQSDQSVVIEGDVEIHQAPFYLKASEVSWQKGVDELFASGGVKLFLDPNESDSNDIHSFLSGSPDAEVTDRLEVLSTEALTFDAISKTITPTGTANIQFGFARIIGEDFNLDFGNETIRTGNYRVGFSSLFIEGDSLFAQQEDLTAKNAHFFIGEPEKLSFQGHARSIEKQGDEAVILRGVRLQLGPVPFFYWPYYKHHLRRPVFSISGGAGYSGDIGTYIELRPTYQPSDQRKFFTDFNFYSERGVLVGPGFNLEADLKSGHHIVTKLETGYIRDNGNLGFDILDESIDGERHFVDFEYLHQYRNSVQILGQFERWSDSEILRDFATGKFRSIQQPQSFLELNGIWGPVALTLANHFRNEAFEYAIERSPELKLRLLPSPLLKTGFYHSAEIAGAKMRNSDPNEFEDLEHTRFRAYYQLLYPLALSSWLDFTPQATVQHLYYSDWSSDDTQFGFTHVEAGFDLTAHTYGEWAIENEIWNIHGIRHILKPTVQFRRIERSGSNRYRALPIEAEIFRTGVYDIDLTANSQLDDLDSHSLIRVGLLNSIIARRKNGSARELFSFDLYHDLFMPEDPWEDNQSLLAANLTLKPAYWLRVDLQSRFDMDPFELSDLFARIQLIDGDIWDLDLATQFIRNDLQQYLFDFRYKVFENVRFVSSVGFDVKESSFFEQTYGLQFGIANYWDLYFSVNLRQGSTRNDETRFELKVKTARF